MTLVAALVDSQNHVHMIGDRLFTNGANDITTSNIPKIAMKTVPPQDEKILIGSCSGLHLVMWCATCFEPPALPESKNSDALYKWCLTDLRQKFLDDFTQHKIFMKDKDTEPALPGLILMGIRGQIFLYESRIVPMSTPRPFWAIGSGDEACMGVLHAAYHGAERVLTPEACKKSLLASMRAARDLKAGIAPPYDYVSTAGDSETFAS